MARDGRSIAGEAQPSPCTTPWPNASIWAASEMGLGVSAFSDLKRPMRGARCRRHGGISVKPKWAKERDKSYGREERERREERKEKEKEKVKVKEKKRKKRWVGHVSPSEWRLFQLFKISIWFQIFLKLHNSLIWVFKFSYCLPNICTLTPKF